VGTFLRRFTADGVHMLICTGPGTVIEADPEQLRVMELHVGRDQSQWLRRPVRVVRWQILRCGGRQSRALEKERLRKA